MNKKLALISLYNVNNLGVRYLTSYLRHKNIDVTVIFFKNMFANDAKTATKKEKELLINILKTINPQIVGISVSCSALFKIATAITLDIQNQLASPVIWGGVHPTILPEESIKVADFVCTGEGEKPLPGCLH